MEIFYRLVLILFLLPTDLTQDTYGSQSYTRTHGGI